jgi:hypothetical protein
MSKYMILFDMGDYSDSTCIVETDLEEGTVEFAKFIAKGSQNLGDEYYHEQANYNYYEDYLEDGKLSEDSYRRLCPCIQIIKLADDAKLHVPDHFHKEWVDFNIAEKMKMEEEWKNKKEAEKRQNYEGLKIDNGDISPTHKLKKDHTYKLFTDEVAIEKGAEAFVGEFNIIFMKDGKIATATVPCDGIPREMAFSRNYPNSGSWSSDGDNFHPIEEWFEEL